jgi:thiol-disulfide isomerase/thioredoxin
LSSAARLCRTVFLVAGSILLLASSLLAQQKSQAPIGQWHGVIQSKAGEVHFLVDLQQQPNGSLQATLINGTDRQPFSSAAFQNGVLTLRMDYYDGTLTARPVSGDKMEGEYTRQTSKGVVHIPVSFDPHKKAPATSAWKGPSLTGDWVFTWPNDKGAEHTTRASFKQDEVADADGNVSVTGTIQPVSGDTGLLHGIVFSANGVTHFHLSRFDGIHVMALDGDFEGDGTLKGEQGGIVALDPFTAERAKDKASADPNAMAETLTKVKNPQEPFRLSGVDASGKTLDQSSPEFAGKPMIVDIFGTWCPNCHDEAPVLEKLYQKYHDQGLQIVGLAYEYTDDQQRSLQQIGIYRTKFGITFPLLLAGTTDVGQIAKTLPQLDGFGAYPTSIFIDRSGHVKAILAGFTGPSTGEKYQEVQQRMDELVREIVGSSR